MFLVAGHNAPHLGQVIALRRLLGCWPPAPETDATDTAAPETEGEA